MDVILHEKTRHMIENYLNQEDKGGVLLIGGKGSGKVTAAKEMAAHILKCELDTLQHQEDYYEFPRGEKMNADEIRMLLELGALRSTKKHKVFLIKHASISEDNQNKLLKLLEDSGEKNIVIFISEKDVFIPTIKSRCQSISFFRLPDLKMKELLMNEEIEEEYIPLISHLKDNRPYLKIDNQFYIEKYKELLKIRARTDIFKILHMVNDKDRYHYFDMVGIHQESIRFFTYLFLNILYFKKGIVKDSAYQNISSLYTMGEVIAILKEQSKYENSMNSNTKKNDFFDLIAKMVVEQKRRF